MISIKHLPLRPWHFEGGIWPAERLLALPAGKPFGNFPPYLIHTIDGRDYRTKISTLACYQT